MLTLEGKLTEKLLTDPQPGADEFRHASEATEAAGAFAQLGIAGCTMVPGKAPSGEGTAWSATWARGEVTGHTPREGAEQSGRGADLLYCYRTTVPRSPRQLTFAQS
jgi:hypothetical protein